ncbi:MAG: ribosomal protein large subunit ribosomal protein [Candidatus Parcubacteria bacterium]|nr:ribosomal protein large subunit ribosomal protein [Candidatus Parcubacteria bacterium]
MQINSLTRVHPNKKRMTVARGGKRGKTSGRGGKGQSARAGNKRRPEWRDIIKKLPKLRGRGKNSNKTVVTNVQKPAIVNLGALQGAFKAGASITPAILVESGVVSIWSGKIPRIKILGDGELTIALKISGCDVSETAKAQIMKAGGTIEPVRPEVEEKVFVQAPKPAAKAAEPKAPKAKAPKAASEKKPAPKK